MPVAGIVTEGACVLAEWWRRAVLCDLVSLRLAAEAWMRAGALEASASVAPTAKVRMPRLIFIFVSLRSDRGLRSPLQETRGG